jgi:hypothetical protein
MCNGKDDELVAILHKCNLTRVVNVYQERLCVADLFAFRLFVMFVCVLILLTFLLYD